MSEHCHPVLSLIGSVCQESTRTTFRISVFRPPHTPIYYCNILRTESIIALLNGVHGGFVKEGRPSGSFVVVGVEL